MRFLDKGLGTLMGLFLVISPFLESEMPTDIAAYFFGMGTFFTIFNLILPYDIFQSFIDWLFESDFTALLGKWIILFVASYVVSRLAFPLTSMLFLNR